MRRNDKSEVAISEARSATLLDGEVSKAEGGTCVGTKPRRKRV